MKIILMMFLVISPTLWAQVLPSEQGESYFKDGIHFEHDPSHFKTRFSFRIQNRLSYETEDGENLSPEIIDFEVRRMRLRLDGTVLDPRLLYRFQFSFTRGDLDYDRTEYPNILRDAVVGWKLLPHTTIWYGQTKLPGNRQRTVSSGDQEFVDRSLVNATFTPDRDLGIQIHHRMGEERPVWIKLAVSNGEGRSTENQDAGLAYTGRLEWLPLGNFKDGGDYFEGDLSREDTPKLSLGAVYSLNKKTTRPGGTIGTQYDTEGLHRDLETYFFDLLLKYRGLSWTTEYAHRWTDDPVFLDGTEKVTIYKGQGFNTQVSYIFENNYGTALRYTQLAADRATLLGDAVDQKQYTFAVSKYLNGHTVKVQTDLTYDEQRNRLNNLYESHWIYRLQLEIGI